MYIIKNNIKTNLLQFQNIYFNCSISQTAYNEKDDIYRLLRKTFALPLIPADDVTPVFARLRAKSRTPETDRFFDYVEETWLHSSIWRVADWSQYGRAIRTNNDLEGWHGKLNRRARKGNLPFYLMAALLFAEAQDLRLQIRLVREGKLRRHQSKRSKAVEGRIWGAWESFRRGSIRTGELLKTLSFIYAPSSL